MGSVGRVPQSIVKRYRLAQAPVLLLGRLIPLPGLRSIGAVFKLKRELTMTSFLPHPRSSLIAALLAAALLAPAQAHRPSAASELSALSALPVAVSVAAPALLLSGTAALTVVAVEASAAGTVWVLERASDGARISLTLSGDLAQGAVVASGTAVVVTAVAAGWVLSSAGQAIAFVPNSLGRTLTHNERVTR